MKITNLHYLGVHVFYDPPLKPRRFVTDTFRVAPGLLSERDHRVLLESFATKLTRGKYSELGLFLRVEMDDGKRIIWIDQNGCVKDGRDEFYMYPGAFLEDVLILEQALQVQKKKRP